jgi:hypothetical protein
MIVNDAMGRNLIENHRRQPETICCRERLNHLLVELFNRHGGAASIVRFERPVT